MLTVEDAVIKAEEKRLKVKTKSIKRKSHADKVKNPEETKAKGTNTTASAFDNLDLTTWLTSLGMKQYVEKFVSQEVDMDTLPYLTESHLEQLGVTTIGARLRLMSAIHQLSTKKSINGKCCETGNCDCSHEGILALGENLKVQGKLCCKGDDCIKALKDSVDSLTLATNNLLEVLKCTLPAQRKERQSQ